MGCCCELILVQLNKCDNVWVSVVRMRNSGDGCLSASICLAMNVGCGFCLF